MKNKLPEGFIQKCIVCKEDVMETEGKFMIAIESPYINLYVHRNCWYEIEDTLKEFMEKNLEEYLKTTPN